MDALQALKADAEAFRRAFEDAQGIYNERDSDHNGCPFCQHESACSIVAKGGGEAVFFNCHACDAKGTIVDLVKLDKGLTSDKDATRLALATYGQGGRGSAARPAGEATRERVPKTVKAKKTGSYFSDWLSCLDMWTRFFDGGSGGQGGKLEYEWTYENAKGEPRYKIVRFKMPDGSKEVRPNWFCGNGWRTGLGEVRPLPLLGLPQLLKADPATVLHVTEGEKCRDALKGLGLLATTAMIGAQNAAHTDWAPAARFAKVVLWPDVDAWVAPCPGCRRKTAIADSCSHCERKFSPAELTDRNERRTNPGVAYVETVAAKILEASPEKEPGRTDGEKRDASTKGTAADHLEPFIAVVDLRTYGLKDGEDIFDLVAAEKIEGRELAEIRATVEAVAEKYGKPWVEPVHDGKQPPPFDPDADARDGAPERKEVRNWHWEQRVKRVQQPDPKNPAETIWVEQTRPCQIQTPIRTILREVLDVGRGWPCRIRAVGARVPTLFVDQREPGTLGEGAIRWILKGEDFAAWMHGAGKVQFEPKLDFDRTNFVTRGELFCEFGSALGVGEYLAAEIRPHEPPMRGHYYSYIGDDDMARGAKAYKPDGRYLIEFLKFWDNVADSVSRAVMVAAALTPCWGGAYGKRPCIIVKADAPGSGKSTFVEKLGDIWGGFFDATDNKKGEEEMMQRLLTPEALTKRIVTYDNKKGTMGSEILEKLITAKYINGKRMYTGDASRPNNICWFVTTNELELSPDMASRSFFVHLGKPKFKDGWDDKLFEFVEKHGAKIVADSRWILKTAPKGVDLGEGDRWGSWCNNVLVPACAHPALAEMVAGVQPREILEKTRMLRGESDATVREAASFQHGIVEHLADAKGWVDMGATMDPCGNVPRDQDVFVSSTELRKAWESIFGRKVNSKWLTPRINGHVKAGRLEHITAIDHTRDGNGLFVLKPLLEAFISEVTERWKAKNERPLQGSSNAQNI